MNQQLTELDCSSLEWSEFLLTYFTGEHPAEHRESVAP